MENSKNIDRVKAYIEAYNRFDIEGMMTDFSDEILFQNIVDQQINLSLLGKGAFREQAEQATELFSQRKQEVMEINELEDTVEVLIDYSGVLKIDLPNGVQAGEVIRMQGKSIFVFQENKVVSLKDIS